MREAKAIEPARRDAVLPQMSASAPDPHDLQRFVDAQRGVYDTALEEIRNGAKKSHWMWFIFPQVAGLGSSPMARLYAIVSLEEARAYLAHPILGRRYSECVASLQSLAEKGARHVFGDIDAIKLRSSLTLFAHVGDDPLIGDALARWCGSADPATSRIVASWSA